MGMEKERMKIMKKITVWNRKGGVGKTTISINLAYELHRKGKKVLCLDLDGQANLTSFFEADMVGIQKPDLARILDANNSFFHVPETDREVKAGDLSIQIFRNPFYSWKSGIGANSRHVPAASG